MEKAQLKVILLLDYASRSRLKVNVSELIMHDVTIVSSLRDITDYILSKTNKVIILEDYIRTSNNYSDLVL
nr:hypothetical protein [uncultured bacterium]